MLQPGLKGLRVGRRPWRRGSPDEDLTSVLAMEASMRDLGVRLTMSVLVYANLFVLSQVNGTPFEQFVLNSGTLLMDSIGHPELAPRLLQLVFQEGARVFKYPFVTDKPLSETATLNPNYIKSVTKATNSLRAGDSGARRRAHSPVVSVAKPRDAAGGRAG